MFKCELPHTTVILYSVNRWETKFLVVLQKLFLFIKEFYGVYTILHIVFYYSPIKCTGWGGFIWGIFSTFISCWFWGSNCLFINLEMKQTERERKRKIKVPESRLEPQTALLRTNSLHIWGARSITIPRTTEAHLFLKYSMLAYKNIYHSELIDIYTQLSQC